MLRRGGGSLAGGQCRRVHVCRPPPQPAPAPAPAAPPPPPPVPRSRPVCPARSSRRRLPRLSPPRCAAGGAGRGRTAATRRPMRPPRSDARGSGAPAAPMPPRTGTRASSSSEQRLHEVRLPREVAVVLPAQGGNVRCNGVAPGDQAVASGPACGGQEMGHRGLQARATLCKPGRERCRVATSAAAATGQVIQRPDQVVVGAQLRELPRSGALESGNDALPVRCRAAAPASRRHSRTARRWPPAGATGRGSGRLRAGPSERRAVPDWRRWPRRPVLREPTSATAARARDSHPAGAGAPVTATRRARPWLRRPR